MTGKNTVPLDDGFDYYDKWMNNPTENEEDIQIEARKIIGRSFPTKEKVARKSGLDLGLTMRMRQQLVKEKRDLLEQEKRLEYAKKKYRSDAVLPVSGLEKRMINQSGHTKSHIQTNRISNISEKPSISRLTSTITSKDTKPISKSKPIRGKTKAQNEIAIKILSEELSRELSTIESETDIATKEAILTFKKQELLNHQLKTQTEQQRISHENRMIKLKIAYQKSDELYNQNCNLKKQKVINVLLSIVKTGKFNNDKISIKRRFVVNRSSFRKWKDLYQKRVKRRELEYCHQQMLIEQQNMNKAVRFERLGLLKLFRAWKEVVVKNSN
jgi:hypothetical protein